MLTVHKFSDSWLFSYLSNPDFAVSNFTKKSPVRLICFLRYLKFYIDSGNAAKTKKIFFEFEINAFELVLLDSSFY